MYFRISVILQLQLHLYLHPVKGGDVHVVEERNLNYLLFNGNNEKRCDPSCWDGNNCQSDECADCFFSCSQRTCRIRQNTCEVWCSEVSDCTEFADHCAGCIFCKGITNSNNSTKTCLLATFEDVTSKVFGSDPDYWNTWKHSGLPYFHKGSPVLLDIDGDNILDYFNPMHGHQGPFKKRMELGIGSREGNISYALKSASERIICTDEVGCDEQFFDAHGSSLIDLDGDGALDIFISNGGGQIVFQPEQQSFYDNWLFWGEIRVDDLTGEEITVFVGGRDAARAAGVEMELGRGRFNYLFDANGDGLLDIFASQDRRVSNKMRPGILLFNQGNRTWKEDRKMMEYSRAMMITDADGDGFANEFLLNRSFCYPQRRGPHVDESHPELGPFTSDIKEFCNTRPVGTNAIYRYNHLSEEMEEISKPYKNFWAGKAWTNPCCPNGAYDDGGSGCNAISMISGDFDNDQIADHVLLYTSKLVFFFSSDRERGELPDNTKYIGLEIMLPDYCSRALSVQIVDIDNNGKEELLVSCINAGLFLVYTQGSSKTDWALQNGCNQNGALGDRFLAYPSHREMEEFCEIYYGNDTWANKTVNETCEKYYRDRKMKFTRNEGVAIYDYNNDGFHDIVSINTFGHLRFFSNNPTINASSHRFICFKLMGDVHTIDTPTNFYGIGATIILHAKNQNGKWVKQFREHTSTNGFGAKDDRIIFGLGRDLRPKKVEVRWPNGEVQTLKLGGWIFSKVLEPIEVIRTGMINSIRLRNQHPDFGNLCLATGKSMDNKLKMKKCEQWKSMKWTIDHRGRISSQKFPGFCLIAKTSTISKGTKVVLGTGKECNSSSWLLTSNGHLKYGASLFVLDFDSNSWKTRLWPLADARRESKWNFD